MAALKFKDKNNQPGSVLILVVVLTALLAVVGTVFVLSARVNNMATSSIQENKALNSSINYIITKISNELIQDTPGVTDQEYYDYPGENDRWLASIEPYYDTVSSDFKKYVWPQISDLTGILQDQDDSDMKIATRHVRVAPSDSNDIKEYPKIKLNEEGTWFDMGDKDDGDSRNEYRGQLADADGDGVADSKWIKLTDMTTGKGQQIYAAVRIIDNAGMINVNTSYKFDPSALPTVYNSSKDYFYDGSTQLNIDLAELANSPESIDDLAECLYDDHGSPSIVDLYNISDYQDNVLRRIESPDDPDYKIFDFSDELDLRHRFCVTLQDRNKGRLKYLAWNNTLYDQARHKVITGGTGNGLSDWEDEICREEPIITDYDRLHLLTCWSIDRIINPQGKRAIGVNRDDYSDFQKRQDLFNAIKEALNSTRTSLNSTEYMGYKAAQIMVNLVDYIDTDTVTTVDDLGLLDTGNAPIGTYLYGFESPCIYLSEIAQKFAPDLPAGTEHKSYAIELVNPYPAINTLMSSDKWYISIGSAAAQLINTGLWNSKHLVLYKEDTSAPISTQITGNKTLAPISFNQGDTITLYREVTMPDGTRKKHPIDSMTVPTDPSSWFKKDNNLYSYERDTNLHYCIKDLWASSITTTPTLGADNAYASTMHRNKIQACPANQKLHSIGDIGNIFSVEPYEIAAKPTSDVDEKTVRIDLANPIYRNLFQYITVFDPYNDDVDNDGDGKKDDNDIDGPEYKIPGRINVNTAPWMVLAQLPWVSKDKDNNINYELSKAIVAYRDKIEVDGVDYSGTDGRFDKIAAKLTNVNSTNKELLPEDPGFQSIGELNFVVDNSADDLYSIWQYALDSKDLENYPDVIKIDNDADRNLDLKDLSEDDLEERDIIFARISNLVTVRSDVFTAYILVRIGTDGPQKRTTVVLDRSDIYPDGTGNGYTGKVNIKARQIVSDLEY